MHSEDATPVHKVTIIPRGQAYLGATMTMPTEDSYTRSRNELLDELVVLMGGRTAEEIIFNDISTGASSDIEVATRIARQMVCIFGMIDKIGPIRYSEYHEQMRVRADAPPSETYSQETAREIDIEVKKLLDDAHNKATAILKEHHDQVELLAQELLEKETLSVAEVRTLIGMPPKDDDPVQAEEAAVQAAEPAAAADSISV